MKISNTISNYYSCRQNTGCNNSQPSFHSMGVRFCVYKDCFGIRRETQYTTGKRDDISLEDFAKVLKRRFRGYDKVNIMPMNVSDGTEAYLFANSIIRNEGLEKFEKKYSPIKASDVMPNVINKYARKGLLHLYDGEVSEFDRLGINILEEVDINDYEDKIIKQASYPDKLYKLSNEYRKYFNFQVQDLQSRILDLKDGGNSVISIRNCLKQSFGDIKSSLIILQLAMRMKGASLLITGDYDRKLQLIDETLKEFFVELKHNIWGLKDYGCIRNYLTKIHL